MARPRFCVRVIRGAYLNGCDAAPSYSGLVRRPLTAVTRVRIPLGSPTRKRAPTSGRGSFSSSAVGRRGAASADRVRPPGGSRTPSASGSALACRATATDDPSHAPHHRGGEADHGDPRQREAEPGHDAVQGRDEPVPPAARPSPKPLGSAVTCTVQAVSCTLSVDIATCEDGDCRVCRSLSSRACGSAGAASREYVRNEQYVRKPLRAGDPSIDSSVSPGRKAP